MLYDYKCDECGNIIEVYQKIDDPKFERLFCNKCDKDTSVTRVICCSTFLLKGDGWAKDGYSKPNNKCNGKCKCGK
jgi:putative FmdB family regulatory protein